MDVLVKALAADVASCEDSKIGGKRMEGSGRGVRVRNVFYPRSRTGSWE